jgi:GTPase
MAVFLDEAKINVRGGNGGNGAVAFFRLKSRGKKIPSGGSGGSGGDVILKATANKTTLYGFRKKVHFRAEDGGSGSEKNKSGKDGSGLIIYVPVGTIVRDSSSRILADLSEEGDEISVAGGGIGGRGNAAFVSQKRRFPSFCEKGEPTEERWINLELRLLADVGLVGFPNAGKSTIISRISAAKPKIADYPFTTIVPHLGVVAFGEEYFVAADIPGIIEGAHKGSGLGDRFLRHITRSSLLVMVLDGQILIGPDGEGSLVESYNILRRELKLYNVEVYKKDYIIVINKTDLIADRSILKKVSASLSKSGRKVVPVSAATGEGIDMLVACLSSKVRENRERLSAKGADIKDKKKKRIYGVPAGEAEDRKMIIKKSPEGFIVKNRELEKMVAMTDLENEEALDYLKNRLKKMKIGERLTGLGIEEGSTVIIGSLVFELVE